MYEPGSNIGFQRIKIIVSVNVSKIFIWKFYKSIYTHKKLSSNFYWPFGGVLNDPFLTLLVLMARKCANKGPILVSSTSIEKTTPL